MRRNLCRFSNVAQLNRGAARAPLSFTVGDTYNGFTFVQRRDFPDLHLAAFEFRHAKTQTPYFHFDTDDTNNAFCMGFCTPALNDKGTTHVLEHTVLCGSAKYPVRDPFFLMLRRSMATFMNAMTGADYTLYPFSTTNAKDYSNLLSVYLDACLKPLLRAEDFFQEGHRLEVEKDATSNQRAVKFNGVVYNEMRGVVSEPAVAFMHALNREMLPGTHYEHVSGGHPPAILDLTHEELVKCHRMYYHPSNAIVMTYGDLPPVSAMTMLDGYFSAFEPTERIKVGKLEPSSRRTEPRTTVTTGPLDVMGDASKQMRVVKSFALPDELDKPSNVFAMSVLSELLTSGPSSPMYKALIESQLGSKYAPVTGYTSWTSTPMLTFGLDGVDQTKDGVETEIAKRIDDALADVAKNGFDQRRVDSVVFQEELQQRHRSTSYGTGLTTSLIAFGLVKPHLHVLDLLNWLPELKKIAAEPRNTLCPLLESATLKNKHASTLVVRADAKHLDGLRTELEQREAKLTATLSDKEKDDIEAATAKWLERVRAPQNADVLPTLTVADIPKESLKEPEPVAVRERVHLIPASTNGLVYVHALVPMFRPYMDALLQACHGDELMRRRVMSTPLMYSLLAQTGTLHKDFREFSIASDLCCSGFGFSQHLGNTHVDRNKFICGTTFGFYTTVEKLGEALALLSSVFLAPRIGTGKSSDATAVRDRIKSLALARGSSKVQSVSRNGSAYALRRAAAATGVPSRVLGEILGGLTQVEQCMQLVETLQQPPTSPAASAAIDSIVADYANFCESLTARVAAGATFWATCEGSEFGRVEGAISDFTRQLETAVGERALTQARGMLAPLELDINSKLIADPKLKDSGSSDKSATLKLPIDTSFVGTAIPNALSFGDADQQALRVAAQIVKNEFLHRAVREEGGAYGAQCSSNLEGDAGGVSMASYRDPTPEKTAETFAKVSEWLRAPGNVTQERVDQSKLRLFAQIDAPMSPDSFGQSRFMYGTTPAMNQDVREKLLAVSVEDVIRLAPSYFTIGDTARTASLVPKDDVAAASASAAPQ